MEITSTIIPTSIWTGLLRLKILKSIVNSNFGISQLSNYWILYISRKLGENICCEVFQFLFMGCEKKSLYHATEKKFLYASFDMMKNKVFVLVGLLFMFHEICHCQKKFSKLNLKANMSKESMTGLHQIVSCSYDKNIILKHIKSFVYSTKEWKTFCWQFFHTIHS